VTALERIVTLPGVRHVIDFLRDVPVPVPVRLFDGARRTGTPRLRLLTGVWRRVPRALDESQQVYDAYAGGDVIDVGAFHGWYSVLLAPKARPGDRFVSFEPDASAYGALLANLGALRRMFPRLRLWALPEAVGDGAPSAPEAVSAHHPSFRPGGDGPPSMTVDALVAAAGLRPAFVKIDVEGAEWHVLAGMRETLAQHRPTLMLELHPDWQPPGVTTDDITRLLSDNGYRWREIGAGVGTLNLLCQAD
jgi:FkbM family methyltransferase